MKKTILVTGASSGIGQATAIALAKAGHRLIICGRRAEKLEETANEFPAGTELQKLIFDVADRAAMEAAIDSLPDAWQAIDVLVNNAGNAHGLSNVYDADVADWDAMIGSNVSGLLYITRKVSAGMVSRKSGHIVNVGSIAGRQAYAKGNVYCATKAAVAMLSDGMRIDLNPYGIKVTTIEPGMVETEFSLVRFKNDAERAGAVYDRVEALTAADVADVIAYAIAAPAHVCIADVLILPTAQANVSVVNRQ